MLNVWEHASSIIDELPMKGARYHITGVTASEGSVL